MSDQLKSFAQELKAKRKEKNITVKDIYEKTRIDAKYLENIENGNFDFMPDVYMRAFIRKYADAVDFSADEAINMYDAARKGKSVEDISKTENSKDNAEGKPTYGDEPIKTEKHSELNDKNNNITIIIGLIVGSILIGVAYYFFVQKGNSEIIVEPRIEEILNERSVETKSPKFEIKTKTKAIKKEIVKSDSLLLKINATDTAWFRVLIDSKIDDEFTLNPNRTKVLTAQSKIKLLLGNAGGVEFSLNGKKLQFSGKKGEIRNISIDAEGIHYLKSPEKLK